MYTEFLIRTENSDYVCDRNMEYALPLLPELIFFAPGHQYDQKLGDPEFKYTREGKYGIVGMNCLDLDLTTDGLNTAGLTTGCLWMPGTQYQENTHPDIAVSSDYFCDWILSTCATIGEVRDALESGKIRVCGVGKMSALLALHFMVSDANGDAIVIEFIDGEPRIYDNPVGVMTNAPQFPWQVTNLQNYVGPSAFDSSYGPPGIKFGDLSVCTEGHGNGLQAISGDSTPPSRFVRTATMA